MMCIPFVRKLLCIKPEILAPKSPLVAGQLILCDGVFLSHPVCKAYRIILFIFTYSTVTGRKCEINIIVIVNWEGLSDCFNMTNR